MEIAKKELIEKLNSNTICSRNAVYASARASIIDNLQDCDDELDIDEVLDLDSEPIDLNSCSSVIDVITTLVYSAYEIALNHLLYL